MDDELIRDDTTFVSTRLASELVGYTSDYIGQLSRDGHINSIKVGRNRYVDRDDLISYADEHKTDFELSDLPTEHRPTAPINLSEKIKKTETVKETIAEDNVEESEDSHVTSTVEESRDSHGTSPTEKSAGPASSPRTDSHKAERAGEDPQPSSDDDRANEKDGDQVHAIAINKTQPESKKTQATNRWRSVRHLEKSRQRADHRARKMRWQEIVDQDEGAQARDYAGRDQRESETVSSDHVLDLPHARSAVLSLCVAFLFGVLLFGGSGVAGTVAAVSQTVGDIYRNVGDGLHYQLEENSPAEVVLLSFGESYELLDEERKTTSRRFARHLEENQDSAAATGLASDGFFSWLAEYVAEAAQFAIDEIEYRFATWLGDGETEESSLSQESDDFLTNQPTEATPASHDPQAGRPGVRNGAVVVSAPTSTEARRLRAEEIRQQFSDEVKVQAETEETGIIQPVFRERAGDEYMYVLVPTDNESQRFEDER